MGVVKWIINRRHGGLFSWFASSLSGWVLALSASTARGQDRPNTLTQKEAAEGWMLLFDGKSLDGWETHGTGDWKAENGAMVCAGTMPSWIGSSASFSDFLLKLEFRGPEKVNSGIFLRSQKEGQPHITGYELQIWDYQPAGFNTGSLVGSLKAAATRILADQWNSYEITAEGDRFVVVLNGKTLLDARESKHSSGVVGFQCQKDNRIEFRSIKLRPIHK
jgi:3-keto-disaccharide hydrolase